MRAIAQERYGDVDVLRLQEEPRPEPGPGEVRVAVRAAGVDPGVWHLMTGRPYLVRLMGFGLRAPKTRVRGRDLAGVVDAVGPGVTRLRIGDEVFGTCDGGSFADYAVAPERLLASKPAGVPFEDAAAVPVSGVTALQAVRDVAQLGAGQRVLVIGAGGGVGSFAVQLAAAAGAEVVGVCSGGKADLVRSLGAVDVVDYTRETLDARGGSYDAVIDTAGRRPVSQLRPLLAPAGTLAIVGGDGGGALLGGFQRQLLAPLRGLVGGQRLRPVMAKENSADLDHLAEMLSAGTLRVVRDQTYPLAETSAAINRVASGHATGKVVVRV